MPAKNVLDQAQPDVQPNPPDLIAATMEAERKRLKVLAPKDDGVPLVAGDVLVYLKEKGIRIKGDTVMAQADGSVLVDTEDSLVGIWQAFKPVEVVEADPLQSDDPIPGIDELIRQVRDAMTLDEFKSVLVSMLRLHAAKG